VATRTEARPPSAVSEKRRQELVLAAYREIAARGFEGLRTREVAAEVGVNIATLHYYFPTKESLIRGVLDHAMERFRTTLAPHGLPEDQLHNHLRAVRKLLVEEPELGAVMAELALRAPRNDDIAAIVDGTFDAWHTTTRGLLRRAVKAGRLRPEMDSGPVAALIVATLSSLTLPPMADTRGDEALGQLERWLGIPTTKQRRSSN